VTAAAAVPQNVSCRPGRDHDSLAVPVLVIRVRVAKLRPEAGGIAPSPGLLQNQRLEAVGNGSSTSANSTVPIFVCLCKNLQDYVKIETLKSFAEFSEKQKGSENFCRIFKEEKWV
jgi:hypothetical protein